MWIVLLLLWLFPLCVLMFLSGRRGDAGDATPFSFIDEKEISVTPAMVLEFAALVIVFLIAGVALGLVLLNFGWLWLIIVPLATGSAATLILVEWTRRGAQENAWLRQHPHRTARYLPFTMGGGDKAARAVRNIGRTIAKHYGR